METSLNKGAPVKMKKFGIVLFILVLLAVSSYFHHAFFFNDQRSPSNYLPVNQLIIEEDNEETEETEEYIPIYEYRLDKTEEHDGYIVETYREYEIYKNEKGKIVKTIPTENYNYIRYKK